MRASRTISDRSDRRTARSSPSAAPAGCIVDAPPDARLTLVAPAGSLTAGVPAENYEPGSYEFRSSIMVLGVEPMVDGGRFPANLQNTVRQLVPGVTVQSASIVKGAETTAPVPRVSLGGTQAQNIPGNSRDVQAWWLTITGRVDATTRFALNGSAGLNRAIARAVAQSTGFRGFVDADYRSKIPTDGSTLDAQFRSGAACSGGYNHQQVYARACTRLQQVGPNALSVTQASSAAPPATTVPTAQPPAVAPAQTCAIRTAQKLYLRDTATFATRDAAGRTFPEFPAGTAVTVTGQKIAEQGALALYPISIAGRTGFGALSAADFVGCTIFTAPPARASGGSSSSSSGASGGSSSSTSLGTTSGGNALTNAIYGDTTGSWMSSPWLYGALAFLGVVAIGGGAYYYSRKARKQNRRHHRARKRNGARARRANRRRGR